MSEIVDVTGVQFKIEVMCDDRSNDDVTVTHKLKNAFKHYDEGQ